jgi:hypothetical protein
VALVRDYIASEANRTVQHALSLVVGIAAVFVPPAPPRDEPLPYALVVFGSLVILVLMTNNILATVNSVRAYVAWRRRYGVVVTAREEQQK